jgi:hypothetical protein
MIKNLIKKLLQHLSFQDQAKIIQSSGREYSHFRRAEILKSIQDLYHEMIIVESIVIESGFNSLLQHEACPWHI